MYRKVSFILVKLFGRRRNILIFLPLLCILIVVGVSCGWFAKIIDKMPPSSPDQNLQHLRRNRNLEYYLDNINLLIEPSTTPCSSSDEIQVVALVATTPYRFGHRQAIRQTWAKFQPTYFVLGIDDHVDELVDIYIESKQYGDMIVWDFKEHYQNLTLKTALMLQWNLRRCSEVQFFLKIDDDVLLNPWRMKEVINNNLDAKLIGYKLVKSPVQRDKYKKWFMPRWLFPEDTVPEFLVGPAYIINTNYIEEILTEAKTVPLINLEDVYFTYLVAKRELGFELTHDSRLSLHKPWVLFGCGYRNLASIHGFDPKEMVSAWSQIENRAQDNSSCFFNFKRKLFLF